MLEKVWTAGKRLREVHKFRSAQHLFFFYAPVPNNAFPLGFLVLIPQSPARARATSADVSVLVTARAAAMALASERKVLKRLGFIGRIRVYRIGGFADLSIQRRSCVGLRSCFFASRDFYYDLRQPQRAAPRAA